MSDELLQAAIKRLRGTEGPTFHGLAGKRMISEREYVDAMTLALAYLAEHPDPNPAHEETAAKFRAEQRAGDGKPDGTREGLEQCARMLDTYAPDLYPANEHGQVHFARAMMESVADEIRAFLAATATAG